MVTGPAAAVLPASAAGDYGLLLERAERAEAELARALERAVLAEAEAARLRALIARQSQEHMPPAEAARRLGVHSRTLLRLEERGRITAVRTPGGHRRFLTAAVDALAAELDRERRAPGRGRTRKEVPCGSDPWGAARHRRDGTEVCEKCKKARSDYQRSLRKRGKG
jgi:excisionase family DNA binding protein